MTNVAAMTALATLNHTNAETLITQNRISTGLRVSTAADNAAYWSIATTMRSDNVALSTVQDALGLGAGTVDIAIAGLNTAIDVAGKIKAKLVAARAPGLDRTKIQSEITQLQSSLQNTVDAASFSGENWLAVDSTGNTTASSPRSRAIRRVFSRSPRSASTSVQQARCSSIPRAAARASSTRRAR
jgi:flagellin